MTNQDVGLRECQTFVVGGCRSATPGGRQGARHARCAKALGTMRATETAPTYKPAIFPFGRAAHLPVHEQAPQRGQPVRPQEPVLSRPTMAVSARLAMHEGRETHQLASYATIWCLNQEPAVAEAAKAAIGPSAGHRCRRAGWSPASE